MMQQEYKLVCGECGSEENEAFSRKPSPHVTENVIKCLKCGHEKVQSVLSVSTFIGSGATYYSPSKPNTKFW